MKVAVVYIGIKRTDALKSIGQGIVKGIESQGHQATLINGTQDSYKTLSAYKYVVIGTEVISFWKGKLSPKVSEYLKQAGFVTGKRSCAFVIKGWGAENGLKNVMSAMEHEGMMINYSEILSNPEEGEMVGKKIQIERD